jgi:peroxiredoxin
LATLLRNFVLAGAAAVVIAAGGGKTMTLWWDGLTATARVGFVVAGSLGVLVLAEAVVLWKLFVRYGQLLVRVEDLEVSGSGAAPGFGQPAGAGPGIGTVAPPFALQGLHGETITLAALCSRGRSTLLFFTDPQCGPCGALIPEIVTWQQALESRLTLTIVSRGAASDNVAKFSTAGVTGVLLQRDREVADAYLSPGTPSCVLVDADGAIASELAVGADPIRRLVRDVSGVPSAPVAFMNGSHGHVHDPQPGGNGHAAPPSEPHVGDPAPDINLPDLSGQSVELGKFRGRDMVVVFWNPECGFCVQLLPELRGWEEDDKNETLDLLIVSTGSLDANRALGFSSTVLIDQAFSVGPSFGAHGTPIAVAIDSSGAIASDLAIGGPAIMDLVNHSRV